MATEKQIIHMNQHLKQSNFLLGYLLLFALSSFAQVAMPKNYQSLLWEITGNGLTKPSYLYGTMHVSNKLAFNLPDSFFTAIKSSDAIALEVDMDSWMDDIVLREEAEKNRNSSGYSNKSVGFYRQAFAIDAPSNDDFKAMLQFRPQISNRLMYRNSKQNSDYEEDNYLDVFIFQAGKKLNKKIVGLEVLKTSEELSVKASREDIEEKDDERDERRLKLKELRGDKSYNELMEDAYRQGDLDMLDSMHSLSFGIGYIKYMLLERNAIMAKGMDSIMRKTPLFTGVGAAHLPGKQGIIELLRKMGYTVKPLNTGIPDLKTKTQIDETRYPTSFSKQFVADSAFSVLVPGKLSEFSLEGSSKYYLFNDIANGSYYCIQRMNHYGKLLDQNQEYIQKRIDSLIFENIPGKLLTKKEIKSPNGYVGLEITNKTAKGDYQKLQIFISATEVFSFKMSGIQEYVKNGTEAENFFSSIIFYEPTQSITNYVSKYGYSVNLPSNKNMYDASSVNKQIQKEIVCASDKSNDTFALMMLASLHDIEYIEVDSFELNMLAERFCLETNKKLISKKRITNNGNPALWFKAESKNKQNQQLFATIIINGQDYYLMCSTSDSAAAENYFASFKTNTIHYSIPFNNFIDTSMFFSVSTQTFKNKYSDLIEAISYNRQNLSKKEQDFKIKQEFLPVSSAKIYLSPETKEKVTVEFIKFSRYLQYATMDDFWKARVEKITGGGSFKISGKTATKKGRSNLYSFLLTDTGSVRGIQIKCIQHCGAMYILRTVIDTTKGMGVYAKTFYDTFEPMDTCLGLEITVDKLGTYFFDRIYSKDTLLSTPAKAAIEYVQANMQEGNIPSLIKTIRNKAFDSLSTEEKIELIYCFKNVTSKETLPFLEELYQKYSDSVELELSVLQTIARLQTADATHTFLKLLRIDAPITSDEEAIENLFGAYSDSLQLAQLLFPEILKYTKYPEYKEIIYSLMAEVSNAKLLKTKVYRKFVDDILLDANYELKKYISDKNKDDYYYNSNLENKRVSEELNGSQRLVYNFTTVLVPFYKNSDIKKYFNKLLSSSKSEKFRAVIYGQLIANYIAVGDSVYSHYSSSIASRLLFYRILKSENKLNLFNPAYLNQKELVVSQLYGNKETVKKDTIVLLSVQKVEKNNIPGNLYVFKAKPKDKKIWKLGYSAIHPTDLSTVNFNPKFEKTTFSFDSESQLQKEIEIISRKIRIDGRKRATVKDFDKNSSDNYYDYFD
jgi:uncharacterized protein YbaP (TraB family)